MAHKSQLDFVERLSKEHTEYFNNIKMLEIGSLDINGTMRKFFTSCEYVGVDLAEGKDVDLICEGQLVDHSDNTYDTTGSCNCFEHNPYWIETFRNMYRMTRRNGLLFIVVPTTGYPEHGTSKRASHDSP